MFFVTLSVPLCGLTSLEVQLRLRLKLKFVVLKFFQDKLNKVCLSVFEQVVLRVLNVLLNLFKKLIVLL